MLVQTCISRDLAASGSLPAGLHQASVIQQYLLLPKSTPIMVHCRREQLAKPVLTCTHPCYVLLAVCRSSDFEHSRCDDIHERERERERESAAEVLWVVRLGHINSQLIQYGVYRYEHTTGLLDIPGGLTLRIYRYLFWGTTTTEMVCAGLGTKKYIPQVVHTWHSITIIQKKCDDGPFRLRKSPYCRTRCSLQYLLLSFSVSQDLFPGLLSCAVVCLVPGTLAFPLLYP